MKRYQVGMIKDVSMKYFYIRDLETMDIVELPTKYLTHKTKSKRSPNTGAAFCICSLVLSGISTGKRNGGHGCIWTAL